MPAAPGFPDQQNRNSLPKLGSVACHGDIFPSTKVFLDKIEAP
jgi:hypothetical protein